MKRKPEPALMIGDGFVLPLEAVTQTFGVLAVRGAGKTYTAAVMVEEMVWAGLPVVVIDPVGVWWGLRSSADGTSAGLPVAILGGDHGDVPLEVGSGAAVAEFLVESRQPAVLDLSRFRKGETTRFMTDFAETLYRLSRAPLHLVIDEADAVAPQRPQKGEERLLGAVEDLVRRGRARGIGVTLVTQRAAVLNKNVLTQIEVLVALRTIAPQDRDAIDDWIRVHGTPEEREQMMSSLASLPKGTAWFWSPGWLHVFQQVEVRRRRTFDSSATPEVRGVGGASPAPALAPVDLAALRERMAATIDRAEATDPKALQRRITKLERELAQARSDLAEERERAARAQATPDTVLTPEREALIRTLIEKLEATREQLHDFGEQTWVPDLILAFNDFIARRRRPGKARLAPSPPAPPVGAAPAAPVPPCPADAPDGAIRAGARRMLSALAQFAGRGLTREQLGTLAGVSSGGGTFTTYLGDLRRAGLVDEQGGRLVATAKGIAQAPASAPVTGGTLRALWFGRLRAGERRMLEVVLEGPEGVSREQLGIRSGVSTSGGTFTTYLGKLRRNGLVRVDSGRVRAGPAWDVFVEGGGA